jgi:tetratricopeptide (TPR) repeat protein
VGLLLAAMVLCGCSLSPETKEARFLAAGKAELRKKDYARAIIQFQNAARAKKGDAEPYYQLSLAYMASGDYELGIPALKRALQLNPKHVEAQIKMAQVLLAAGGEDYVRQAEAQARKLLANSPENADALNALAIAEWKLGQAHNAEEDFVRVVNRAPQNIGAALNLATVKLYAKDRAGAEDVIKKAAAANPKSADPVTALGALYALAGESAAAEQQYLRAVQIDPKNEFALASLANLYQRTNRPALAEPVYKQISLLPDPKYRLWHARFLFQAGKRDEAVAEIEKLVAQDAANRTTLTALVEAYFAVGRVSDAERALNNALDKNNKDVDALLQRSRIYLLRADYANAQKDIAQVLRFQGDSAPAHYVMARIHQGRGESLSQRQELSEALRLNQYLLPARLELAQLFLKTNSASAALQVLNDTPDSQKLQLPVVEARHWALWSLGDMSELRKSLDAALRVGRTPDLLIQDGLWNLKAGKASAARASLEEALKISPSDLRALEALTWSYTRQNQGSVALSKVKEYAARQPKSAAVQDFLGTLLVASGDKKQARAAFEAAQAADPNYIKATFSLVQVDLIDGKLADAHKRLEGILASDKENPTARLWLANVNVMENNEKAALEQYRQLVAVDPNNAEALNNLAYLLSEINHQPAEALKYAQKAKELNPESPEYADTLGWVLYRKGLYPLAVQELERAASKKGSPVWKYHLAMAYARTGEPRRARTMLDAALKQNPNLPEAKAAQEVLGPASSK